MPYDNITWEFLEMSAYGAFRKSEREHICEDDRSRATRIQALVDAGHDFGETVYD